LRASAPEYERPEVIDQRPRLVEREDRPQLDRIVEPIDTFVEAGGSRPGLIP